MADRRELGGGRSRGGGRDPHTRTAGLQIVVHFPGVRRMHLAAAAEQVHAAVGQAADEFAGRLGVDRGHEPVANALETAGVGHHDQLQRAGTHRFRVGDRIHKSAGIPRGAAIDAGHGHAQRRHAVDERDRIGFERVFLVGGAQRHLRNHRRRAGTRLDEADEEFQLRERTKGFQQQGIGAGRNERIDLLVVALRHVVCGGEGLGGRTDRGQHEERTRHAVISFERGNVLARHFHAGPVDGGDAILQTELPQLPAVRAEGIGLQAARTGGEIGEMDLPDQVGLVDVEGLVNVVRLGQPPGQAEQIGPHRPIGQERLGFEGGQEVSHRVRR